jgi:hypothetical protein
MNTDGVFHEQAPELYDKIVQRVLAADKANWGLLQNKPDITLRCIEFHTVETGGALAEKDHYDWGSLLTLDILLCDGGDYEGGQFHCADADGVVRPQPFETAGDAIIFCSHKKHYVLPVEAGRRRVCVIEFWQASDRSSLVLLMQPVFFITVSMRSCVFL